MTTIKKYNSFIIDNLAFVVFGLILFLEHCTLNFCNDDLTATSVLSMKKFIVDQYYEWGSRIVITPISFTLCKISIWYWRIFDTAVFVLLAYLLSYLLVDKNKRIGNWIVCGLLLLYPFNEMNSAGWVSTAVDYLWVFAFGCLAFVPLKKYVQGISLKWYEYIVYALALLFAANQEQMAIITITVYLFFTIYLLYLKELKIFVVIQLLIAFSSLLFALTCPGNYNRLDAEISRWMNEFLTYSPVDKFTAGFMTTLLKYLGTKEITVFIIELLLFIELFRKYNNVLFRVIAGIPLLVKIIFGFLVGNTYFDWLQNPNIIFRGLTDNVNSPPLLSGNFQTGILPGLTEGVYNTITPTNYLEFNVYLSAFLSVLVVGCIIITLFILLNNFTHFLFWSLIIGASFVSRIVMGFSPTLYASQHRTFIFFHFTLVALCLYIINTFYLKNKKQQLNNNSNQKAISTHT